MQELSDFIPTAMADDHFTEQTTEAMKAAALYQYQ